MNASATEPATTSPLDTSAASTAKPTKTSQNAFKKQKKQYNNYREHRELSAFDKLKNSPLGTILILIALNNIFGFQTLILAAILVAVYNNY